MGYPDIVRMGTLSTGAGSPITLDLPVFGFRTFSGAAIPNGAVVRYAIEDPVAGRETCTGTYNSGAGTLTRVTRSSSNGNAPLVLSGQAQVLLHSERTDVMHVATVQSLATTFIPSDVDLVQVGGYYSVGDNGAMLLARNSSVPTYDPYALDITGQVWKAVRNQVFTPEMWGAKNDAVFDNTAIFTKIGNYITVVGEITLRFARDGIYLVWPSGTIADQSLIMRMGNSGASCSGIDIDFNGSVFETNGTFAVGTNGYVFYFENCDDVRIKNAICLDNVGNALSTPDFTHGVKWFSLANFCRAFVFENIKIQGGIYGIGVARNTGTVSEMSRCKQITIDNIQFEKVFYPINCQKSGDDVKVRNCVSQNHGRAYFPYNVKGHDVEMVLVDYGNILSSGPFGCVGDSTEQTDDNTMADMRIKFRVIGVGQTAGAASYNDLFIQQAPSIAEANVQIRNVQLIWDIQVPTLSASGSNMIFTQKLDRNGVNDSVTRNHTLENISISGTVHAFAQSAHAIALFTDGANWNENVRNISIRDFVMDGAVSAAILVDATPFQNNGAQGQLHFERVHIQGNGGSPDGEIQISNNFSSGGGVTFRDVKSPNLSSYSASLAVTWGQTGGASPPSIGNGSCTARVTTDGLRRMVEISWSAGSSTTFGDGTSWTFTLPAPYNWPYKSGTIQGSWYGTVGGVLNIGTTLLVNTGGHVDIRFIDKNGNNVHQGFPGTFASGDFIIATCTFEI